MHQVEVRLPNGSITHIPISGTRVSAGCILRAVQSQQLVPGNGYITCGTRLLDLDDDVRSGSSLRLVLRVCGGKGGYGNTLRALGRKGGNTNNVSDCRDLSGHRLRDIQAAERASSWAAEKRKRDAEEQLEREKLKMAALDAKNEEKEDIIKALKASRHEQSVAQDVVAQGLRHQATQAQAGTGRPVRRVVHDPQSESDSDSSDSDDAE